MSASGQSAMSAADGRTQVSLDELIALRLRVARAPRLHPVVARASRSGGHHSRLRGRGMDYVESRAYQAGDDMRQIDWRLTARSGRMHTKLFQEERERSLWLLVDCNPGMYFGTRERFKSVQAARAAALAAWCATHAGERVGVLAIGGSRGVQRPQAGSRGALAVVGALAAWDAAPRAAAGEDLGAALQRIERLLHGASRVMLISDGLSCDAQARNRLLPLRRHAEVAVLTVADALELAPPAPGRYPFEHDGARAVVDLRSRTQRSAFQRTLGAGPAHLQALATALGMRHRCIDTRADPLDAVGFLLGQHLRHR
jgi:uncharacterized protein (DUF58 family)